MKQVVWNETQKQAMEVIDLLLDKGLLRIKGEYEQARNIIMNHYNIPKPYLTLKQYIEKHGCGAYHTFEFVLDGHYVQISDIYDFLTDNYAPLYPLTSKFYVVKDERKDNKGNVETYHCFHKLNLEPKED